MTMFAGLTISSPVYAYLDPGSGSVLLQGLLAGTAGIVALIKLYWSRLKIAVVKRFYKSNSEPLSVTTSEATTTIDINDDQSTH